MAITVIDLFCGCGGISLGFQMAGYRVIYGLDNNKDAINTFQRNFPDAIVECKRIEDIIIESIPHSDIIVGGPPCVNFSSSKGSRANVLEGLRLVQAFLRIVYLRAPRYWLMENVPRIGLHLPETIPLRWIGIDEDGELHIPVKQEFDISLFGAPQKRKRLLIGNFPIPTPNPSTVNTLGNIVTHFPDPSLSVENTEIIDPHYPVSINSRELTDHFMDTTMTDAEAHKIKMAKTHHPFMGYMPFPDDLDKPARTVVALQMGRETLVIKNLGEKYRRATIRECATLQTFPISFQFAGNTVESRYRQAGNAVPPILTYNIASLILEQEGEQQPPLPLILQPAPFDPPSERREAKARKINLSASRIIRIPYKEVRGTRVELCSSGHPKTQWEVNLHLGEGKSNHHVINYTLAESFKMTKISLSKCQLPETMQRFEQMINAIDMIRLQSSNEIHEHIHQLGTYPPCINEIIGIYEKFFPKETYGGIDVDIHKPIKDLNKKRMRIRILVALPLVKRIEMRLKESR